MSASSLTTTVRNILVSGLGGGLDIHNAMLMYLLLNEGKKHLEETNNNEFSYRIENIYLGSIRPCKSTDIENPVQILSSSVTLINSESKIKIKGRYFEPTLSKELNENIFLMTGSTDKSHQIDLNGIENLKEGLKDLVQRYHLTDLIFVDGGGDSLILKSKDSIDKIHGNVFMGGDAVVLAALNKLSHEMPHLNLIQGIISVGLDVNRKAFKQNIKSIANRGGYFGRINFATGKDKDTRNHNNEFMNAVTRYLFGNDTIRTMALEKFFTLSEQYLVLQEDQCSQSSIVVGTSPTRFMSHTAVVTYHALKGNFGLRRTFVPWEPKLQQGKGVVVEADHQWMYFVNPAVAEQVKISENGTSKLEE
ncbi:hypothetical protein C9374_003454 [Naegleria lovaniensis]|uniref:Uncharacterized protein n=1 Tax=Naegleria lovaniensis TaxID=51637 RepID=A0AA88GTS0_NAELO|nr:uncharacterized protein C9374_003454 [Naegleria lovaniensis]KAG2385639.1 hypothetical protein C9374_003454 [Naegleria lovaniensis]